MTTKFVDKIDPYHKAALKRQRRSGGSSTFHNRDNVELQPLPLLTGGNLFFIVTPFPVDAIDFKLANN